MTTQHQAREVVARLRVLQGTGWWPVLARRSRVPYGTIAKLAYGETTDPRYGTVYALLQALPYVERLREHALARRAHA